MICSLNFLIFLAVCLNISTVINIKILTNSNQQTQSYKFTSHIAAFLFVVLITEMLEICIQTSYDQNVQLIFKELSPCSVWYPLKWLSNLLTWGIADEGKFNYHTITTTTAPCFRKKCISKKMF